MISLRLRRMGAKKRPSYRIVAADSRSPRDGRVIESFGLYDPVTDPATVRVDAERARHWLSVGAQPSDTVRDIFRREGILGDKPRPAATGEPVPTGAVAATGVVPATAEGSATPVGEAVPVETTTPA